MDGIPCSRGKVEVQCVSRCLRVVVIQRWKKCSESSSLGKETQSGGGFLSLEEFRICSEA